MAVDAARRGGRGRLRRDGCDVMLQAELNRLREALATKEKEYALLEVLDCCRPCGRWGCRAGSEGSGESLLSCCDELSVGAVVLVVGDVVRCGGCCAG